MALQPVVSQAPLPASVLTMLKRSMVVEKFEAEEREGLQKVLEIREMICSVNSEQAET